jgi:hypothetical protein
MKLSRRLVTKTKLWLVLLTISGLTVAVVYALFGSNIFSVSHIRCNEEQHAVPNEQKPCQEVIVAELSKYEGSNTWRLDPNQVAKQLEAADQSIKKVEAKVASFNTLDVLVIRRIPSAQLTTSTQAQQVVLVDEDGIILGQTTVSDSFPKLIWSESDSWAVEEPLPPALKLAIALTTLVDEQFGFLSPPVIESKFTMKGQIKSGEVVVFSLSKDPLSQVRSLQVVLTQARIDKIPSEIDLRFRNPVIKP